MPNTIFTINNHPAGVFKVGLWGDKVGTIPQIAHDGDTIAIHSEKNFSVRFLGIDAPEVSCPIPGTTDFVSLNNEKWVKYLKDLFNGSKPSFISNKNLFEYLKHKVKPEKVAENHYLLADEARKYLIGLIEGDIKALNQTNDTFQLYLSFAFEIMDRYGRFLCYINRYDTDSNNRPFTYNERLLQAGMVCPYFIWANVNPSGSAGNILDAVVKPKQVQSYLNANKPLKRAIQFVKDARMNKLGIFGQDKLQLEPFELRYISRQAAPERYVIDLSNESKKLIAPDEYYKIENAEDRLFIPGEYVPLFRVNGWK
jgi:endonuclease YncB( thermonuclease family)